MANFDSELFGLVFPRFQATQKIHAQNSPPDLSAFLSNFTFLNPKFVHGDFLLTGETNKLATPQLTLTLSESVSELILSKLTLTLTLFILCDFKM